MTAHLFPMDGVWMLKIDRVGIYVETKEEGIELCRALAPKHCITTLKIAEINNGFISNIDEQ